MADMFYTPMNRRKFIQTSLGTLGAAVTMGVSEDLLAEGKNTTTRLVFLADTHVPAEVDDKFNGLYPYRNLQEVAAKIITNPPEGVIVVGDLARSVGLPGEYVNLQKLLKPLADKTPVFLALGNHDDRGNFYKKFKTTPGSKQPIKNKHVIVINMPHLRLIVLDSLYAGKVAGLLGKVQRDWLDDFFKNSDDTPTLLCFHHTLEAGDKDLLDVPYLFRIIKPHRQVKGIIYGHSHSYNFSQWEGIQLVTIPSTGYNFREYEPVGWVEAQLNAQGGEFKLHAIAGDKKKDGSITKLKWRT